MRHWRFLPSFSSYISCPPYFQQPAFNYFHVAVTSHDFFRLASPLQTEYTPSRAFLPRRRLRNSTISQPLRCFSRHVAFSRSYIMIFLAGEFHFIFIAAAASRFLAGRDALLIVADAGGKSSLARYLYC